jgi:AmiR/NasT family two-component response regulator
VTLGAITRPAIANERVSRNAKGQVVLKLKSPYRDGTTHIVMQPREFMQRLAALVPRPRLHLIRPTTHRGVQARAVGIGAQHFLGLLVLAGARTQGDGCWIGATVDCGSEHHNERVAQKRTIGVRPRFRDRAP